MIYFWIILESVFNNAFDLKRITLQDNRFFAKQWITPPSLPKKENANRICRALQKV
jgi:hypothetical protein